jgi:hypothetical protein
MARARELYDAGWGYRKITRLLANELGVQVSHDTVKRWTDPEFARRARERATARNRRVWSARWEFQLGGARPSDEYRVAFMRRLRSEGVSCAAVGKVCGVVFGQPLTHHQVRYALGEHLGRDAA